MTRAPFDRAVKAARTLHRNGMAWPAIGRELGYGHNRLRNAVNAEARSALNVAFDEGSGPSCSVGGFSSNGGGDDQSGR